MPLNRIVFFKSKKKKVYILIRKKNKAESFIIPGGA